MAFSKYTRIEPRLHIRESNGAVKFCFGMLGLVSSVRKLFAILTR